MQENPYNAPKGELPQQGNRWVRVWLHLNGAVCFFFALSFGVIGLLWAAGAWRWLQIEADGYEGDNLQIYGFEFSYGQVLLLGSASALGLALVLVYIGLRIVRPSARQD